MRRNRLAALSWTIYKEISWEFYLFQLLSGANFCQWMLKTFIPFKKLIVAPPSLGPLTSCFKKVLEENKMSSRAYRSWRFGSKFPQIASELKSKNVLQVGHGHCPIVLRGQASRRTKPVLPWVSPAKDAKFKPLPTLWILWGLHNLS